MIKKNMILKRLNILLLILLLLCFACISSQPSRESETAALGKKFPDKENKIKDKIIIPDETPIPVNNPESIEMAATSSNADNSNTASNFIDTAPAVPIVRDVPQENNEKPVTPQPVIIIKSTPTPTPEPLLPETENPGDVWIYPRQLNTKIGRSFQTGVHINTGVKRIAAYGIKVFYNRTVIELDNTKENKVVAGQQGFEIAAKNLTVPGMIDVSGFDTAGKGPSRDFELFIIYWKAITKGSIYISVSIGTLVNDTYETIGTPRGISGLVTVE